ncbi:MAG: hypothetical protein WAN86_18010 [Hyphomicrobiaceae bacterium]
MDAPSQALSIIRTGAINNPVEIVMGNCSDSEAVTEAVSQPLLMTRGGDRALAPE